MSVETATTEKIELDERFLHSMRGIKPSEEAEIEMENLLDQLEDKTLSRLWAQVKSSPIQALDDHLGVHFTGGSFLERATMTLYQKSKDFQLYKGKK